MKTKLHHVTLTLRFDEEISNRAAVIAVRDTIYGTFWPSVPIELRMAVIGAKHAPETREAARADVANRRAIRERASAKAARTRAKARKARSE